MQNAVFDLFDLYLRQVLLAFTPRPSSLSAPTPTFAVEYSHADVFSVLARFLQGVTLKVWVVVRGRRCGYMLRNTGFEVINGTGDNPGGATCSFMSSKSDGAYVFKLDSGASKILLPPGLPPPSWGPQNFKGF